MAKEQLLLERLNEVEKYCSVEDDRIVQDMIDAYYSGMHSVVEEWLTKFPSQDQLLEELIEKLKGKSVYKTLKAISEGKVDNSATALKGLFSLGTHIAIEIEKGKREYGMLLPTIHERIGRLILGE